MADWYTQLKTRLLRWGVVAVASMAGALALTTAQTEAELAPRTQAPNPASVRLEPIVTGLNRPLFVTHAPDDSGRVFILEQGGVIYVWDGAKRRTFMNVTNLLTWDVNSGGYTERGLLGLAFHPNFAENGLFYINYTDRSGATAVVEFGTNAAGEVDMASARLLLTIPQPFPNHNGGHMAFGEDGYLYISVGDGGAANDPLQAGQNIETLLGKILRIDVNGTPYAIPADNPFVGRAGMDEIWAYGVRNVWRFSFDRATGDMYVADVGQNKYEEVNFQPAGVGGFNYGWNAYEGSQVFRAGVPAPNAVMPIAEYEHSRANGCSITGGYVYRGEAIADLQGAYLYSDYCSGRVWYAYRDAAGVWQSGVFLEAGFQVSSFGEDAEGELYIVDYRGRVLKFVPAN